MVLGLTPTPAAVAVVVAPPQDLGRSSGQDPLLLIQHRERPSQVDEEAIVGHVAVVGQAPGHDRAVVVVAEHVGVDDPIGSSDHRWRSTVDQEQLLSMVEQEPTTGAVLEMGGHGQGGFEHAPGNLVDFGLAVPARTCWSTYAEPISGIGTLNESSLHAQLKELLMADGDEFEVDLDGFVIDIRRTDLLIEIQTSGFGSMGRKLDRLLSDHRMLLVPKSLFRIVA